MDNRRVRLGVADHLGWAVAVTASADHEVVDRRRIELIEPGVSAAPIHYESSRLDVAVQRRAPYEARADAVLQGPRATMGPRWTKDHRTVLAATIVAG